MRDRGTPAASTRATSEAQHRERRRQPRLVARDVGHEAVRVPRAIGGRRRQIREIRPRQPRHQIEDVRRRRRSRPCTMIDRSRRRPSGVPASDRPAVRRAGPRQRYSTGARLASIAARYGSSHGGSFSSRPSDDSSSSAVNPGCMVATSNSTPPGSRK